MEDIKSGEASDKLFSDVYVPAFVKRCAARGVACDQEHMGDMLKMAYALRVRAAAAAQQQVEAQGDLIKSAALALERDTFGEPARQPVAMTDVAGFTSDPAIMAAAAATLKA